MPSNLVRCCGKGRLLCAAGVWAALVAATGATARSSMPTDHASAAANGTLKGNVAPSLRPSAGAVTTVRAIAAQDGATVATGRVGVRGTFRLAAAPGVYLVVVEKVSPGARPVVGFGRLVRLRSGRTSVVPTVNPGSAARRTTSGVSSANGYGAASATKPAVAVRNFAGSGPQAVLGRGLAAVVTTELFGSRCYVLVEWEMRPQMLQEIVLQQSRFGDPSTRVTPRWIAPTVFVEGSVSTTAVGGVVEHPPT